MLILRRKEGQWVEITHRSGDVIRVRVCNVRSRYPGQVDLALDDAAHNFVIQRPERTARLQAEAAAAAVAGSGAPGQGCEVAATADDALALARPLHRARPPTPPDRSRDQHHHHPEPQDDRRGNRNPPETAEGAEEPADDRAAGAGEALHADDGVPGPAAHGGLAGARRRVHGRRPPGPGRGGAVVRPGAGRQVRDVRPLPDLGALRDVQRALILEGFRRDGDLRDMPGVSSLGFDAEEHGSVVTAKPVRSAEEAVDGLDWVLGMFRCLHGNHLVVARHLLVDGLTQGQAAALMGLSKSRISYIYREAKEMFREEYDRRERLVA